MEAVIQFLLFATWFMFSYIAATRFIPWLLQAQGVMTRACDGFLMLHGIPQRAVVAGAAFLFPSIPLVMLLRGGWEQAKVTLVLGLVLLAFSAAFGLFIREAGSKKKLRALRAPR